MKKRASFFRTTVLAMAALALFQMCQPETQEQGNPPMAGFNQAGSDKKATELADAVMAAQGGRQNWDKTRYITWNFFDSRKLLWDKATGNVRIEYLKEDMKVLLNVNSGEGQVYRNGTELTQPDSVAKYVTQGKEAWINDSYWLVMPFKLKDSGVTLKYQGEDTTEAGKAADVLQLTFENVGVTPENRYKIFVDKESNLVSQWAYFQQANDSVPAFVMPWQDYQTYGHIKLSGDRGKAKLTDIKVLDEVPEKAFTSFEPVNL